MCLKMLLATTALLAMLAANGNCNQQPKKKMENFKEQIERLSPLQRNVTQNAATEPPFQNEYYNHFQKGTYSCIVCGTPLFHSESKFNAGCGWPAFSSADTAKITTHNDLSFGMRRIEVRCAKCNAHLGHLFYDGPTPTGERYCINSAALRFVPSKAAKKEK